MDDGLAVELWHICFYRYSRMLPIAAFLSDYSAVRLVASSVYPTAAGPLYFLKFLLRPAFEKVRPAMYIITFSKSSSTSFGHCVQTYLSIMSWLITENDYVAIIYYLDGYTLQQVRDNQRRGTCLLLLCINVKCSITSRLSSYVFGTFHLHTSKLFNQWPMLLNASISVYIWSENVRCFKRRRLADFADNGERTSHPRTGRRLCRWWRSQSRPLDPSRSRWWSVFLSWLH